MTLIRCAAVLHLVYPAVLAYGGIPTPREDLLARDFLVKLGLLGAALIAALGLWHRRAWAYWLAVVVNALPVAVGVLLGLLWDAQARDSLLPLAWAIHVNGAPCASLALLLQRDCRSVARPPGESHWSRAVAVATAIEVGLIALFMHGWGDTGQFPSQTPGEVLLSALSPNLCCSGFQHTVVYTDMIGPPWFGLNPEGVPILVVANTVPLAAAALGGLAVLRFLRRAWRGRGRGSPGEVSS